MSDQEKLERGWAWDLGGMVCHFEHFPLSEAEQLAEARNDIYVLETVNWTLANPRTCHLNHYFVFGLAAAVAAAARFEIESQEVAEELVQIRPAAPDEIEMVLRVHKHFMDQQPDAISEKDAIELPLDDDRRA